MYSPTYSPPPLPVSAWRVAPSRNVILQRTSILSPQLRHDVSGVGTARLGHVFCLFPACIMPGVRDDVRVGVGTYALPLCRLLRDAWLPCNHTR